MKIKQQKIVLCLMSATLALASLTANASYQILNVAATAGPWSWQEGGLNDGYRYGLGATTGSSALPDYTAPVRLKLSDLGLSAGDGIWINYHGGLTSAFGGIPTVNNNGYEGSPFKDDSLGSSGEHFPSVYYPGDWGSALNPSDPGAAGVFLQALLGAMTDDNGNIIQLLNIGTIFPGPAYLFGISFSVPVGATYVQFGFNDDIFADNTGSIDVCVSSANNQCRAPVVPVPAAFWLFASGASMLFVSRRKLLK